MRPNPNTNRLDDKIIASDVLATTKMLADTCSKYAIDSATPAVRQTLASLYMEGLSSNERVFRFMENRGWYSTSKADQQQISQIQSKFGGASGISQGQYNAQTSQATPWGAQSGYGTTQAGYGASQTGYGTYTNQRY